MIEFKFYTSKQEFITFGYFVTFCIHIIYFLVQMYYMYTKQAVGHWWILFLISIWHIHISSLIHEFCAIYSKPIVYYESNINNESIDLIYAKRLHSCNESDKSRKIRAIGIIGRNIINISRMMPAHDWLLGPTGWMW